MSEDRGCGFTPGVVAFAALLLIGCGKEEGAGTVVGAPIEPSVIAARAGAQAATVEEVGAPTDKQILFGDLHVHSTFSIDAFMMSLPFMQGEGAHPVSDACDFARHCSGLDFWSINDHAESLTPLRWRQTKEAIRRCNAVAGDPADPDMVAFLGWEWTQVGPTPDTHYGHKNVIFRDLADDEVPRRPIHSAGFTSERMRTPPPLLDMLLLPLADPANTQRYLNLHEFQAALARVPDCPRGIDTRELVDECLEGAGTPRELFDKLHQWGFDTLVIPHGNTWGIYTPRGSSWDKQLAPAQHDPDLQTLIEVFSGHGNSEEYRDWRAVEYDEAGQELCPEPVDGYEPCCWRAGEIIRARCDDPASGECEKRVRDARRNFLAANTAGRLTIPDAEMAEWGNCGSCPDCYLPSMNYRPGVSAQYALALSNFETPEKPNRFHFGFIASSDNHRARPGTGYKEYGRLYNTEAHGPSTATWYDRLYEPSDEKAAESVAVDPADPDIIGFRIVDFERQASFFMTGGLVAVHSEGRSRDKVWGAMKRREVYGTSGERILLWFDLLNGPEGEVAMGNRLVLGEAPRFRVRAAGGFKQKPGCPELSATGLSAERRERLCRGECYNPSDERHPIDRIEVVRIRRQNRPDEPVAQLVDDPWRVLPCERGGGDGCVVEFEDREFAVRRYETAYYVRAIQAPTPAVNAGALRCRYDENGRCTDVDPCYGDYRTPSDDDCLATNEERAWSSPIYLAPPGT